MKGPVRLGAVDYLNVRPLVYQLDRQPDRLSLRFDVPVSVRAVARLRRHRSGHGSDDHVPRSPGRPHRARRVHRIGGRGGVRRAVPPPAVARRAIRGARHVLAHVRGADSNSVRAPLRHQSGFRAAPARSGQHARVWRTRRCSSGTPRCSPTHQASGATKTDLGAEWTLDDRPAVCLGVLVRAGGRRFARCGGVAARRRSRRHAALGCDR